MWGWKRMSLEFCFPFQILWFSSKWGPICIAQSQVMCKYELMQSVNHLVSDKRAKPGVYYVYINCTHHSVINCACPASWHECAQAGLLGVGACLPNFSFWPGSDLCFGLLPTPLGTGVSKCLCKQCSPQKGRWTRLYLGVQTGWAPRGHFISHPVQLGRDGNYHWMSKIVFFNLSLSFTTGEPGQFQSSYGKFLRCDKDCLDFCSIDFYGTRWL